MGAGVLGLPHAFSFLGWGVGIVVLLLAGLSALFTATLLAAMHEANGVRHNRYALWHSSHAEYSHSEIREGSGFAEV